MVILPCGHVACDGCMWSWVKEHKACPFCRLDLRRSGCDHHVKPSLVAHDRIHKLPKTLPQGGVISSRCMDCTKQASRDRADRDYEATVRRLRQARQHYEASGTEAAFGELKRLEASFENSSVDTFSDDIYKRKTKW
ncbi:hypothetical protein GGR53DRAFT_516798 [Hypoxylon sp. FL1150]|nr:hypothetical protein GGR53DRAFT_516798 [Hypoxylon sp. FL1150]